MNRCFNVMHKGYIAVEFFFILSGFFIYRSSISTRCKGVLDYTLDKVKKFYPPMLIMMLPTLCLTWNSMASSRFFNDLFFISHTGIFGSGVNGTLWYLNVLVVGGGLIYAMLKHFRAISISLLFPIFIITIYTYIFSINSGSLEIWTIDKFVYMPLMRGIAGMSLGAVICCFFQKKKRVLLHPLLVKILNVLFCVSFIGQVLIVFLDGPYDRYVLVFSSIIILTCFVETSIANCLLRWKGWNFLGELSLEMYIVHFSLTRIFLILRDIIILPDYTILIFYILMVIFCAYALKYCSKKLTMLLHERILNNK